MSYGTAYHGGNGQWVLEWLDGWEDGWDKSLNRLIYGVHEEEWCDIRSYDMCPST